MSGHRELERKKRKKQTIKIKQKKWFIHTAFAMCLKLASYMSMLVFICISNAMFCNMS